MDRPHTAERLAKEYTVLVLIWAPASMVAEATDLQKQALVVGMPKGFYLDLVLVLLGFSNNAASFVFSLF